MGRPGLVIFGFATAIAGCSLGDVRGAGDDTGAPDGGAAASHGGKHLLLPWAAGTSYPVTQGHNTGSHVDFGAWAWDFGMNVGTHILAAHDGVVRAARGDQPVGGCSAAYANDANYVILDRGDGFESLYLHLSAAEVTVGETVTRGQEIGLSGQSGWACGAHLHLQIQRSPSNGGTDSFYNPSVEEFFHDSGAAVDWDLGASPVSHNGTSDEP